MAYAGLNLNTSDLFFLEKNGTLEQEIERFVVDNLKNYLVQKDDKLQGYYLEYNQTFDYFYLYRKDVVKHSGYVYNTYDKTTNLEYTFKYVTVHIQDENQM